MAIKICLDAGHYGKVNRSPAVADYYESEMNWRLHLYLKEALEVYGMEVITTRANQKKDLALVSRGRASKGCDLFLSIHSNAAGSVVNETVDYPVAIVQLDGKGNELGLRLAQTVQETMQTKQKGKTMTRKGSHGEYYGVLRGAAAVGTMGIILEHSFHTNTRSTKWLLEDVNLQAMAKAEAKTIADYFGVELPQPEKTVTVELKVVKKGSKGDHVKAMQTLLIGYGYSCGSYGADGSCGGATVKAIKAYQEATGLAVDGSCGAQTWNRLLGV